MDWEEIAGDVGAGIAKRAQGQLKREMDFATFISALNIRHCDSTAKDLVAAGVDTPKKLCAATIESLEAIDGVGPVKARAIAKGVMDKAQDIGELSVYLVFEQKQGGLVGQSFCFTGAMSKPRKELEQMAIQAGADIKKSVSKGLTYLVIADPNSNSSKAQKARKLGTECISEETFIEMASRI
jgi:NAD-dependent DNA ligase